MRKGIFIQGIGSVMAQGLWRPDIFSGTKELDQPITRIEQPSYKGLIPPAAIRRMSRGIKMGIYAAQQALDEASVTMPDAIITGTGMGCSEDSDKFLQNLWENDEQFLTPTSFIQSTHNTVAAQIALRLQCRGYNVTYVHGTISFESALLDTFLQLCSGEVGQVLLGGVDEVAEQTYKFLQAAGYIKADGICETVKTGNSPGVNYAEGASFFSMGTEKNAQSYAQVVDVLIKNELETSGLDLFLKRFLDENHAQPTDIDAVILGYNGDPDGDAIYATLSCMVPSATPLYYKHLTGQFDSCSAFGLATAAFILKHQIVPPVLHWDDVPVYPSGKKWKNILLYNQCSGKDHSFILVRAC